MLMIRKTTINQSGKATATKRKFVPPTESEIALCAYAIYAKENPQRAIQLWREAEAQLTAARKHDAELFHRGGVLVQN